MAKYYAMQKGSSIMRTFVSLENRNDWIAENPKQRRKLNNGENQARRYRDKDGNKLRYM